MSRVERSLFLLKNARFFTLASRSHDGEVWASTVNFVPAFSPLCLVWCSLGTARHSENIEMCPQVSGSVFMTDIKAPSVLGLDGAQFTGKGREIPREELEKYYNYFAVNNFPDEALRRKSMPPLTDFTDDPCRRFYELKIKEWWLLDVDCLLKSRIDQRVGVDINSLVGAS